MQPHYTTTLHNQANQTRDQGKPTTLYPAVAAATTPGGYPRTAGGERSGKWEERGGTERTGHWGMGNPTTWNRGGKNVHCLCAMHLIREGAPAQAEPPIRPPPFGYRYYAHTRLHAVCIHTHIAGGRNTR